MVSPLRFGTYHLASIIVMKTTRRHFVTPIRRTLMSPESVSFPTLLVLYRLHLRRTLTEISYTIRYPQFKESQNKWAIRQSAVYHCYNTHTGQSVFILFSPMPNSLAERKARQYLDGGHAVMNNPFWLHEVVFSSYFPAWRQYIANLERQFLPIVCIHHTRI